MSKKVTVVYDDRCPICTAGKNVGEALDSERVIDFVGMNTERGKAFVQTHNLDMNASAYAFRADGTKTEKSEMIRDVLAHNELTGFIMSLPFRIPYFSDKLYNFLAWTRWHVTKSQK